MTDWFDTFFDALAHDVWDGLVPDDASDQEAEWLAARLGLAEAHDLALLDVPSGAAGSQRASPPTGTTWSRSTSPSPRWSRSRRALRRGSQRGSATCVTLAAVLPEPTTFDGSVVHGQLVRLPRRGPRPTGSSPASHGSYGPVRTS